MSKKRKMMIGAAVVVAIAIVVSGWFVLLRNKDETRGITYNGQIELSFSEMPTLNKTVNVTLTIKIRDDIIGDFYYGNGRFIFFTNLSQGFEWIEGKAEYSRTEFFVEGEVVDEIDEPYFESKNCSDVWGKNGKYAKITGIIKVVKPGNWTIAGGLTKGMPFDSNPNRTSPIVYENEYKEGIYYGWLVYTFITIHVDGNSSYVLEEVRKASHGPLSNYYHYWHPSLRPEVAEVHIGWEGAAGASEDLQNKADETNLVHNSSQILTLNLSLSELVMNQSQYEIICDISSAKDLHINGSIKFLQGNIEIINGSNSRDNTYINANETLQHKVTVNLIGTGNFSVYAEIYSEDYMDWRIANIQVNETGASIEYHPSSEETKYRYCHKLNGNATPGGGNSITINGEIQFWDDKFSTYFPNARVLVRVYDTWWGKQGETEVQNNGQFSITISDAIWPADGRDLYVNFVPECANVKVKPPEWGYYYYIQEGVVHVQNGGTWTIDTIYSGGAFSVFGYAVEGWRYMNENGYGSIGETKIIYPYENGPHYHPDIKEIHLPDWDYTPLTVLHEYGHHVMNMGMGWPSGGSIMDHNWYMELTPAQAWTEGWAYFFPYPVWDWISSQNGLSVPYTREEIEEIDQYYPHYLSISPDTFSVRWTGTLTIPTSDTYTFYLTVDDGAKLWIDNSPVVDAWDGHPLKFNAAGSTYQTAGTHDIKIEYYEITGDATIKLYWQSSAISKEIIPYTQLSYTDESGATHNGLLGEYYDDEDFTELKIEKPDPTINFLWGTGRPIPIMGRDKFSVWWFGKIMVDYSETYTFYTYTDDGVILYIDGTPIIEKWQDQSATEWSGSISLTQGLHSIQLLYYENKGDAVAKLSWKSPSQTGNVKGVIPSDHLYFPDYIEYPPTAGYTFGLIKGGLLGYYYDNKDFTNLKMVRVDPKIDFSVMWGYNSPVTNMEEWPVMFYAPGDVGEARVASALYDIYDSNDDGLDSYSPGDVTGFSAIWFAMTHYDTIANNFEEFYDRWRVVSLNIPSGKQAIFWNTIDYNTAPTCTISNLGTGWYRDIITLSTAVSDTDTEDTSSYLQVEFWYSTNNWKWIYIGTTSLGSSSLQWDTSGITDDSVWIRARGFDGMEYSSWDECDSSFKVDNTDPTSSVDVISSGWKTSMPITITATANDIGSALASVSLYYRYSSDNTNWGSWTYYATDTGSPWSWSFTSPNGDGYYEFYSIATDNAGNIENAPACADANAKFDTTAPSSSVYSLSTYQTSTSFTVSWDGSDPSPCSGLKCYDVQYKDGSGGTWTNWVTGVTYTSKTFTTGVNEHTYYFQCRATDNAGNTEVYPDGEGDTSTTIDTTPPSTTHSLSPVTPDGNNGWYKTTPTVTLTVTEASSGVAYTEYKIGTGSWQTYTSPFSVPDGENTISYYSVDNAGNPESPAISFSINVDTKTPTTTDNAPSGWQTTKPITVTLTANDSSPGSGVAYTDYKKWFVGTAEPGYTAGTTITISDDGKWYIKYYSVDNAGNSETPITKEVWIDTIKPTNPNTYSSSPSISIWTKSLSVSWEGAYDATSGIAGYHYAWSTTTDTVPTESDIFITQSSTTSLPPSDGSNWYLHIRTKDNAGNFADGAYHIGPFWIDRTQPNTTVTLAPATPNGENSWYTCSVTLNLTAVDSLSGVLKIEYRHRVDSGSWSTWIEYTGNITFDTDGTHRLVYKTTDRAGNYDTISIYYPIIIKIDKTPPTSPIPQLPENGNKTWDRSPTFTWQASSDTGTSEIWYYNILITNLDTSSIVINATTTSTSYTPTSDLGFHNYSWRIGARDYAGNYGNWSETRNITIYKVWGVILTPFPWTQSVSSGGTVTYTISVWNLGNDLETFYVNITSNTSGWAASLITNWVTIDYGNTIDITLNVTAPEISYGTGYVSVLATAQTNTSCCASITVVTYIPVPLPEPPECQPINVVGIGSQFGPFSVDVSLSFSLFCNTYIVVEGDASFTRPGVDTPHFAEILNRLQERRPFIDWKRGILPFLTLYDNVPTYTNLIEPGGTYTYQITVTNPSDSTVTIYLTPFGVQLDSWHAVLDRAEVTLEPYETIIVNFTVTAPLQTENYQATIIVSGTLENALIVHYAVVTATLTTWMNPVYLQYLEPARIQLWNVVNATPSNEFLLKALEELNNSVSYANTHCTLELAFNSAYRVTGYLKYVDNDDINGVVDSIVYAVRVASERAVSFADMQSMKNVTYICKGVEWYSVAMETPPSPSGIKYFTLAYIYAIEHNPEDYYSFEISITPEMQVKPGETASYTITITNTGVLDDEHDLSLITDINSAWINFSVTNVEIPANSSATILLRFTLPSDLPLMYNITYPFEIRVTSVYAIDVNDNAITKSVSQALTVIATKESKTRYMINEVEELITTLDGMDIQQGVKNSLQTKLQGALDKLNTALDDILNGDENHADKMLKCAQNKLNAFINEVEAQRSKKISNEDADILVNAAQTIISHVDDTIATPL